MIVKHSLPGRFRVHLPLLREARLTARAEAAVRAIPGVLAAEASRLTGNLLVHYDQATISGEELLGQLTALSEHLDRLPADPPPDPSARTRRKMARHVAEVAGGVAVERLVEVGMRALIARWA